MRFVLIHGGFHGAWCWERTIPELEKLGHAAVAIDLPGHGRRRDEASTLANRSAAIVEILQDGDVLVGHSGGGFDITLAANDAPEKIGHLVYLASGLPLEGRPLLDVTNGAGDAAGVKQLTPSIPPAALAMTAEGRLQWVDKALAAEIFYHDCDARTVDWAFAQFSPAPPEILIPPVSIPRFWAAELPRSYIICLQDKALSYANSMLCARRLGVVPLPIAGSHSPFLSRPAELAALLVRATATAPVARLSPD